MGKNTPALADKYTLEKGRIFVSGAQALTRLPMLQQALDQKNGRNTAGFISGYRGSPLAGLDRQLWQATKHLEKHHITFTPAVNEDLGATAVWGSQQTGLFPDATYDGVFAMWYGKGPGVDRSLDAIRHANGAGTNPNGGVLALMGDDHACVSSTLGHQSDHAMMATMVPVLYPSSVQEYLDFGLLGWAMSRYAGCWVGLKCATEVVESSASVDVGLERVHITLPQKDERPPEGLNIRMPDAPLDQETRLEEKINAALAFAKAHKIDQMITAPKKGKLGIITGGKSFKDVMQALEILDLNEEKAKALGIRIYKVGMVWPLEPTGALNFAKGLSEILVVEEKRSFIEEQLKTLLFEQGQQHKIRIFGKKGEARQPLLPSAGGQTPTMVALALAERIAKNCPHKPVEQKAKNLQKLENATQVVSGNAERLPYYCAGCPHNQSTKVPEGSRAIAGIGCHYMVQWMNRNSNIITHMGGEGVNWVGHAPFTTQQHVFTNLGDGTYYHSGTLAIRQAVAAQVNITYKILYNDAVAMTGGQPVDGPLSVAQITHQMAAEGVSKIYVVSDAPEKYHPSQLASGVRIGHRRDLDTIQQDLRQIKGTSILIYDQTCAAELRRRRKRGDAPDPAKRAFINPLVCEGCGDCSAQSNCVAIEPIETEFGRKRQVNQSSCNKDFSCIEGFCPSFVTISGGDIRREKPPVHTNALFNDLPAPARLPLKKPCNILVTGIGGTGVITIGAILGMAAHLEGKGVSVLDQTGLAQKNGAVMSHIRIAQNPDALNAARIATGQADVLLGCDAVVSASDDALKCAAEGQTTAFINSHLTPTAAFTLDPDADIQEDRMMGRIRKKVGPSKARFLEATHIAKTLMGDPIATNMFMLGYAWQAGEIPLEEATIFQTLRLNNVAVEANINAFKLGRLAAHKPQAIQRMLKGKTPATPHLSQTLDELIKTRVAFLKNYQNKAYAHQYEALVTQAQKAEAKINPASQALTEAVARYAFKLMAYKDEYEVARLYTSPDFKNHLRQAFQGRYKITFHLAPPLLSKRNHKGELQKKEFSQKLLWGFSVLKYFKFLRTTWLDPFGYTAERKMERRLIADYRALVGEVCTHLTSENYKIAVALLRLPEEIRGFGHIKERHITKTNLKREELLKALREGEAILPDANLPGHHLPTSPLNPHKKQKIKIIVGT